MNALVLRFPLESLRRRWGGHATPGADPRHDGAPFRAFRAALLAAAAERARAPAAVDMWWEGTFNGYSLCVSVAPPDALPGFADAAAERACDPDDAALAPPRAERYPLAVIAPGRAEPAADAEGARWEAPFGAATGHFGAPGMRRVR